MYSRQDLDLEIARCHNIIDNLTVDEFDPADPKNAEEAFGFCPLDEQEFLWKQIARCIGTRDNGLLGQIVIDHVTRYWQREAVRQGMLERADHE